MKASTAIILAIPIALGIFAWIARAPERGDTRNLSQRAPAPDQPDTGSTPPSTEIQSQERAKPTEGEKSVQRWRRQRLLEDFETRVRQLIESIDWTRADSRVRFPVEHERLQAEYDEALGQLPAADE